MASSPHLPRLWLVAFTSLCACGGLFELNPLYSEGGEGSTDSDATDTGGGDGDGDGTSAGDGDGDALPPPEGMAGDSHGTLWIDATEVTVAAYAVFLAAEPSAPPTSPRCAAKQDYTPDLWDQQSGADKPVGGVDWCDAYAYCEWEGKRLCAGKVGEPFDDVSSQNEWFYACSDGLTRSYPYGTEYEPQTCNGDDSFGKLLDVRELPGCEGGFSGLFDMIGNVWEWTDACGEKDGEEVCVRRGGSYFSAENLLECAAAADEPFAQRESWIGFRCCADPGS